MKTVVLFIIMTVGAYGQAGLSINPGVKFGIAFGEKTQFIFGGELSFVYFNEEKLINYGIVLDLDKIDDVKRFHVGSEIMYKFAGIDIGPTFAWKDSKPYYGFSVIPFGGALIIPYVNYTYIKGIDDQFDLGAYLKIPIPFFSKRFSFGG